MHNAPVLLTEAVFLSAKPKFKPFILTSILKLLHLKEHSSSWAPFILYASLKTTASFNGGKASCRFDYVCPQKSGKDKYDRWIRECEDEETPSRNSSHRTHSHTFKKCKHALDGCLWCVFSVLDFVNIIYF